MQKTLKYTIFKTKWGYFGLAGAEYGLLRTHLPSPKPEKIKPQLLKDLQATQFDKNFFRTTQEQIAAYFEGARVNFSDVPIVWDYYTSTCHSRTFCHSRASGNPQTIANAKSTHVLPIQRVTEFTKQVLTACRNIGFGRTISYSGLAKKLDPPCSLAKARTGAARAVGSALAKNPLPLIVPCHRIVCSDGKIGGFSATGGKNLKAKLLKHEHAAIIHHKSL
jgi:O-6-methylguanine DNA methyltransferase